MSAIRTDALDNVTAAVDRFSKTLMDKINNNRFALLQIKFIRQLTKSFGFFLPLPLILIKGLSVDIYDFSKKCSMIFFYDSVIKEDAKAVMDSIDKAVVANTFGNMQLGAKGLHIFFPRSFFYNSYIANKYSSELDFTKNTSWDEFLELIHNN
jgi:hypothetical protein